MAGLFGLIGSNKITASSKMIKALATRGSTEKSTIFELNKGYIGLCPFGDDPELIISDQSVIAYDGYLGKKIPLRSILADLETNFVETIPKITGSFAMALWNKLEQSLYLVRDPSGTRPLYYSFFNSILIFASSPKSIIATGLIEPELNPEGISHFLSMIAPPDPITIYQHIYSLPPGYSLVFQDNEIILEKTWNHSWSHRSISDFDIDNASHDLRTALESSVKDAIPSDTQKTGFFLSGGTDTTAVVGLAAKLGVSPINTFTIGYEGSGGGYSSYNEFQYAKIIAEKYNTVHHEFLISPDNLVRVLPKIIANLDQPSGDAINSYLVAQTLPSSCLHVLTGTAGDEVFIGSQWYQHQLKLLTFYEKWKKLPEFARQFSLSLTPCMSSKWKNRFLLLSKIEHGAIAHYQHIKFLFSPIEKLKLFNRAFSEKLNGTDSSNAIVEHYDSSASHSDNINRLASLLIQHEVANVQLRDLDTMCYANGHEARSPLSDFRVVDALSKVPGPLKMKDGILRYLMFEALSDIIPSETRHRPKMSFIVPMDLWARRDLKKLIQYTLSKEVVEKRGIFEPEAVKKIHDDFYISNRERHSFKIWVLALFELWCRLHIDTKGCISIPEKLEDLC